MSAAIVSMHSPLSQRPQKKQKMSITQTYFLAHTARGKLSKEASRADHDLRLLVGHANLLDTLMIDLAHAEEEQENWFNQTVSASKAAEEEQQPAKHIQWADTLMEEEEEEDWQPEDGELSESDSEDEEEEEMTATPLAMSKPIATATTITTRELADDEYEDDEEEDYEDLALTRTSSHHVPELTSDSEEESEDDSAPPSPPNASFEFSEKERQAIATTSFYDKQSSEHQLSESEQSHFFEEGYYLPSREQPAMIPAY